jgi:hypothetical protein
VWQPCDLVEGEAVALAVVGGQRQADAIRVAGGGAAGRRAQPAEHADLHSGQRSDAFVHVDQYKVGMVLKPSSGTSGRRRPCSI